MSEKRPIVKVSFYRPKEAFYKLSPQERNEIGDKVLAKFKELGVKQPSARARLAFFTNLYI